MGQQPLLLCAPTHGRWQEKWQDAASLDTWGEPHAANWGLNMRFGTGLALLDFTLDLQAQLGHGHA